jgi:SAM-dependent methyltransferase
LIADQFYTGHRVLEAMRDAQRYADAIFDHALNARPLNVTRYLDFGAGDGVFLERFLAHGCTVDCVEPDPAMRVRVGDFATTVYSNICEVGDAHYDFAYTINVLEHIGQLDQACGELFRVLHPGGRLFVFVPAFPLLWTSLDAEVGHVCRFTRRSLRRVLESSGFRIIRLEFFDCLGFPAALGVRVLESLGLFRYSRTTIGAYDRYVFPISHELDRFLRRVVGKNLLAIAERPTGKCLNLN